MGREASAKADFARPPLAKYGAAAVRNLVFRYDDSPSFLRALREADQELLLPDQETVNDGEWVLAIFEVGETRRATAAAARGLHRGTGAAPVLAFERRDWERLEEFAQAGSLRMRASKPVLPPDRPTKKSLRDPDATLETEVPEVPKKSAPSFSHWQKSDPLAQGPTARVLLVDDDRDIREVVGAMLDAVGLTVEGATSAEEALERARKSPFDLMVLDWNLPGMTGVELCRLIRKDTKLSLLPVLFLTAHASSRDIVEAFASGADDYVVKPFRAPELGARIFGLLRRARMTPASP
jgi:two-component system phosphate regulon response regulator PhoB